MLLAEAKKIVQETILYNIRHANYDRVVKLAKLYTRLVTGEESSELLKRFIRRETQVMFDQRVLLTNLITPAICAGIMTPFQKVSRNNRVTKRVEIDETKKEAVEKMQQDFYGGPDQDANGLDFYLQNRFVELSFTDPNAWVAVEFDSFDNKTEMPKPRPFEASAEEAIRFFIDNGETKWLVVMTEIAVKLLDKTGGKKPVTVNPTEEGADGKRPNEALGKRYTIYTDDIALTYDELNLDYVLDKGEANEEFTAGGGVVEYMDAAKKKPYLVRQFNPNFGFVQAKRIGYNRDPWTRGETFVSPFHSALPFLMKSVKTVSEYDLTMALHAFPQKFQYVPRCKGKRSLPCSNGKLLDNTDCTVCGGTGFIFHKAAHDVVTLPMPEDKESFIDLSKIIHYAAPPTDLLTIQKEIVGEFNEQCHQAVFNSSVFVTNTIVKTATEKDHDMDNAYDTLHPFASAIARAWKFFSSCFIVLAGAKTETSKTVYIFPADFKLKNLSTLIADLKAMNESGAPSFVKDAITDDIADLVYAGDAMKALAYRSKKSMYPFPGKTETEILVLLDSPYVTKFDKVLYCNFEKLFAELERDNPKIYTLGYPAQWKILEKRVNEIITEVDEEAAERFNAALEMAGGKTGEEDDTDPAEEDDDK